MYICYIYIYIYYIILYYILLYFIYIILQLDLMIHIHTYIYIYYTHIIYWSQTWSFSNRNAIFQACFVNGPGLGHPSGFLVEGSVIHRVLETRLESLTETQRCSTQGVCRQGGVTRKGVTRKGPVASISHQCLLVFQVNVIYTFILAAKLSTKRELGWCLKMFVTNHPHPVPRHCYRRHRHQYYYHYQTIALGFSATNNLLSLLSRTLAFFRGWRQLP